MSMLLRQIIASTFCLSLLLGQTSVIPASANEADNTSQNDSGKKTSNELQTARAIRIGFIDGVIKFVKNSARTRIQVEWEPLPISESIIKAGRIYGYEPIEIKIRNEDLADGKWISKISQKERNILKEALGASDLSDIRNSGNNFQIKDEELKDLLRDTSLNTIDYLGYQRDRKIITTLLENNGISYSVEIPKLDILRVSDKKINWNISIYKFVVKQQPEVAFYRFGAKATVDPFEILISNQPNNSEGFEIKAGISLKKSDKSIGLLNNVRSFMYDVTGKVTFDSTNEELISELADNNALNQSEGFLTFAGGAKKLGDVISKGLLGGNQNTSIVSGGIIDFDGGEISPFFGVNSEIAKIGDSSAGFMFGAGLDDKTSLFVGPSLQTSIFTLSAGGLAVEGDEKPDINFAGLISVDLSRLTRSKKVNKTIPIENTQIGGGWGKVSEKVFEDLALLEWKFSADTVNSFKLIRVCDSEGFAIQEGKQTVINVTSNSNQDSKQDIKIIPKGIYKYDVPSGFQLIGGGGILVPINPKQDTLDIRENNLKYIEWEARKENGEIQSNNNEGAGKGLCKQQKASQ